MDGFTFFKSYYESAQHLSDKDQAQFYKLIMDYMFTGEEPQLQGHLMGFWLLVKPNLDTSKSRAKAGQTKSKPNLDTSKSRAKAGQTKSKENQKKIKPKSKPKPSPLEDKERDKDKDIKKQVKKDFTFKLSKITQYENLSQEYKEQFVKYAIENIRDGGKLLSEMVDYHTSNGKGFKDWSAALRTWVRNDKKFSRSSFKGKEPEVGSIAWRMQQQQNEIDVEVIE